MKHITYSLIIPTFNRLEEIKELFISLDNIDQGEYTLELILVDDGSTDGTEAYLKDLKTHYNLKYFRQNNQGPGSARNLGMSKATGNYFLFIDSDCTVPPDYLNQLSTFITKHHPDAFGGPDTFHASFSPLLKAINYSMTSFIGTGGTRGSKKSVTKYYPRSFNMGIHNKVYHKIGGFGDLRHGQDMDFSARIYNAGFKVSFIPEAYVYHKRRTDLFKFYRQIHNWGVARINLGKIHPQMLKPIHFAPALIVVGTIISLLISFIIPAARLLLILIISGILILASFAFVQSFFQYRNLKVALLSIITLFVQVFAYGIGFINGVIQVHFLKRNEAKGITKNYY